MPVPFFPGPLFGWSFCLVLLGLAGAAAYVDWRTAFVPKQLTLTALGLGVLFNLIRGAWLGAQGDPLWVFGADGNLFLGLLDGLLLSLSGFGCAFGLFFFMWILGTCGGGDVKLFAALGAWVGPWLVFLLFLGSTVVLFVLFVLRVLTAGPSPSKIQGALKSVAKENEARGKEKQVKPSSRRMTFSLPVAIGAALILLWVFREELHLAAPPSPTVEEKVHAQ